MSSLILSQNSHLMMLEIAVKNLFVPWTTAFDKVIMKKTIIMFRMLDKDWTTLSPNRYDYRPYHGSNCENEKFYGGRSVVFSLPADFFGREASGVDVELDVRKQVCKYFETVSRQRIGFVAVPVDDLLNSIAKQIRERDELAEHLSDFYKRQIISRSMMGTYVLLDENFRNTAATISLYIRISYLGKCLVTEITQVESIRRAFYIRGDSDEKQSYFSRQLTSKELQSGCWVDSGLPRVPYGRLICRCKELIKKEAADLAKVVVDTAAIKRGRALANKVAASSAPKVVADADVIRKGKTLADITADSTGNPVPKVVANTVAIKTEQQEGKNRPADAIAESAMISVAKVAEDVAAVKEKELESATVDSTTVSAKIAANAAVIETRKAPADYRALKYRTDAGANADARTKAYKRTTNPVRTTDNEVINRKRANIRRKDLINSLIIKDVRVDTAAIAKTKGHTIKNNIRKRVFKKAFSESSKSKRGRNTVTIGITEREKRILPPPTLPFSRLQTYLLCCQLQPHLTCFTDCFDVSPCYCYTTC